jgi:hypothetical protein
VAAPIQVPRVGHRPGAFLRGAGSSVQNGRETAYKVPA